MTCFLQCVATQDDRKDTECISYKGFSKEMKQFLTFIVPSYPNMMIAGRVNSGKTMQLNRLLSFNPPSTRILLMDKDGEMIEDLKKQMNPYLKRIGSCKVSSMEQLSQTTISFKFRQDMSVLGEIQDEMTAQILFKHMYVGHVGWSSIHANSAKEAATRLLQLNKNTSFTARHIADAIDILIFQKRLNNGRCVIVEISELLGYQRTEEPILNPIFTYNEETQQHERVGKIQSQSMLEKIALQEMPDALVQQWCERKETSLGLGSVHSR